MKKESSKISVSGIESKLSSCFNNQLDALKFNNRGSESMDNQNLNTTPDKGEASDIGDAPDKEAPD